MAATIVVAGTTPYSITYQIDVEAEDSGTILPKVIGPSTFSGLTTSIADDAATESPLQVYLDSIYAGLTSQELIRAEFFASGKWEFQQHSNWYPALPAGIEGVFSASTPRLSIICPDRTGLDAVTIYFTVRLRHSIGQ